MIEVESREWIGHPNNLVDLIAYPIGRIFNAVSPPPFFRAIDPTLIPSQHQLGELDGVEEVLMVGYPIGLWDAKNNYPLIRRGTTASHPAVDFDVNGVAVTVIDIAAFPGSSGSPVLLYNKSGWADKKGNFNVGQPRLYFIGVLYSGPVMQNDGTIVIKDIPTAQVAVPRMESMINLGYVIKAREIDALGAEVRKKLNV